MEIRNVAVVGAGNMGAGIAQSWAQAGFHVRLHDMTPGAIERAFDRIEGPLRARVAAGRMDKAAVDATLANLHAAPWLEDAVQDADLVVEAIFEDLAVKRDLFARLDASCAPHAVLATNTSSLRVADIAAATARPERVVGLHYFFPAAINRLVEVVRQPATPDDVAQGVRDAVRRSGKIPVETADEAGFCVNRFFVPWINESCRLVGEGVEIPTIEAAAKQAFGISMGPFELMNVTGVPISLHAQTSLHAAFGPFYEPAPALVAKVEAGGTWDLEGEVDEAQTEAVAQRLRGVAWGIACHLVEEGVASMLDTDRGATIGLRWAKGPFAMMNEAGLQRALAAVQAVHSQWNDAFPVPAALRRQAAAGTPWHLPAVRLDMHDGGRIALVTFDRPESLNALDAGVLADLDACLGRIEAALPRAVVVTGSGKAFIAGADIPTMRRLDAAGATEYTRLGHRVLGRLAGLRCPVIMALNGHTYGGGLELALCGDLLHAAEGAKLGLPEVGLGIHPGFGGTQRLPRRIGPGAAKTLVFTGRTVDAKEALRIGLVDQVWPDAQLLDGAMALAREIASKAPLAVQGAKRAMDEGAEQHLTSALSGEQESVVLLFASKDKQEGLDAFAARRPPRFVGA